MQTRMLRDAGRILRQWAEFSGLTEEQARQLRRTRREMEDIRRVFGRGHISNARIIARP